MKSLKNRGIIITICLILILGSFSTFATRHYISENTDGAVPDVSAVYEDSLSGGLQMAEENGTFPAAASFEAAAAAAAPESADTSEQAPAALADVPDTAGTAEAAQTEEIITEEAAPAGENVPAETAETAADA